MTSKDPNDLLNEAAAVKEYFDEVKRFIKKEEEKDLVELEETLQEMNRLYRKHAFDDDQKVCKGYRTTINTIKQKIKEIKHEQAK